VTLPGLAPELLAFIGLVREYTRDRAELNRMTNGEESSDRMIAWAVVDAVKEFNSAAPITHYTLRELLDYEQQSLLVRMTVCALLEGVALLQTRNHLTYSTGDATAVNTVDRTAVLMNWLQYFRATVDQKVLRNKVALNISLALTSGGIHSEYVTINGFYPMRD
jgi:hypothetical protein